jgi:hypothetical protein
LGPKSVSRSAMPSSAGHMAKHFQISIATTRSASPKTILDEPADRFEMLGARMDTAVKRNNVAKAAIRIRTRRSHPDGELG